MFSSDGTRNIYGPSTPEKEVNRKGRLKIKIIAGEHFPSWILGLITKIILIIFIAENNSWNLVRCLLMAFSDLEGQKHKNFLEKHHAGARVNIKKNPYRASFKPHFFFVRQAL